MLICYQLQNNIWIYLLSWHLILGSVKVNMLDETKCFDTVVHYYSNPKITDRSKLYISYKNDDFKKVQFELNCGTERALTSSIHIEDIYLIIPAEEEDMCLDSHGTSYRTCHNDAPCPCCQQPAAVCRQSLQLDVNVCNGKPSCIFNVTSEFLEDCPGRQYNCQHKKCHSRWAQVTYKCEPHTEGIVTTETTQFSVNHDMVHRDRLVQSQCK